MNQVKKQNRILLAVLAATLAAAAVLLALTGSANKKKAEAKLPPAVEEKTEETVPEQLPSARPEVGADSRSGAAAKENAAPQKTGESERRTAAEDEEPAVPTAAQPSSDDVLPRFTAPVDGFVIKECSLTVPVFTCTMNDYRTHAGLDFACSPGTPVCAAADGVVCEASRDPMMGVTIAIRHNGGAVTTYRGLSEESLEMTAVGQSVSAGQAIGSSGQTALIESAEEDHLHFELTVNGAHEDPAEYMKVRLLSRQPED